VNRELSLIGGRRGAHRGGYRQHVRVARHDGGDLSLALNERVEGNASAASVVASSCPVSSLGNRPLGAAQKSHAVATRITAENAIVPGRCSMTHARLRVYAASARSYTRAVARSKRPCVTPRSERGNRAA